VLDDAAEPATASTLGGAGDAGAGAEEVGGGVGADARAGAAAGSEGVESVGGGVGARDGAVACAGPEPFASVDATGVAVSAGGAVLGSDVAVAGFVGSGDSARVGLDPDAAPRADRGRMIGTATGGVAVSDE